MFLFTKNTRIVPAEEPANGPFGRPVRRFIRVLERDRDRVLADSDTAGGSVELHYEEMEPEQYRVQVGSGGISVCARDDLGMGYALLFISERFLGVKPFWFYMDQQFVPRESVSVPEGCYEPVPYLVRFRGWFINDEVLMMGWDYYKNGVDGWEMALEALLRCGGNMVIPGTDQMSRKNRALAADMGLWITHHHAEPLGAEMFARAYPGVEPSYPEHPDLFRSLWEQAVLEQKDYHVIWNLCFRGQGDAPFWESDKSGRFAAPEARGRLIGDVIREQCRIVKSHVEHPVFCTNLYGEIMELYEQGFLELDPDIIKVRADNGFGRMVTRRQGNHNPRVSSMPDPTDAGAQGIYYHVSFYDLQAANHITQFPNSIDFINHELAQVFARGGRDFWIVNCSNIRPHVYCLDAIRKIWSGISVSDADHSAAFAEEYFGGSAPVAGCYRAYPKAMIPFGPREDEHMGEQYYTENVRVLVNQLFRDRDHASPCLQWLAPDSATLRQQAQKVCAPCAKGLPKLEGLLRQCGAAGETLTGPVKRLFDATIHLHAVIHVCCAKGTAVFGEGCEAFFREDYDKAFLLFGDAACLFGRADAAMKEAEYGVWKNFYENECLADVRYTAYMLRKAMGLARELGDGVYHEKWQRKYCEPDRRGVTLLMFTQRHKTDWELYLAMKAAKKTAEKADPGFLPGGSGSASAGGDEGAVGQDNL